MAFPFSQIRALYLGFLYLVFSDTFLFANGNKRQSPFCCNSLFASKDSDIKEDGRRFTSVQGITSIATRHTKIALYPVLKTFM